MQQGNLKNQRIVGAPVGTTVLGLLALSLAATWVSAPCRAGQRVRGSVRLPAVHRAAPVRLPPRPFAVPMVVDPNGNDDSSNALLHHMVKANQAFAFIGREITINANGAETEQWVRWDPRQGLRRESIRPLAGDILIDNFRSSYLFSQRDHLWTEKPSLLPRPSGRINDVLLSIKSGDLRASWVGQDMVAGRTADIVRIYPAMDGPALTRRVWIDRATGIRLKSEDVGPAGRILSTAYYVTIEMNPRIDAHDFEPPAIAPGAPPVRVVETQRYRGIDEALKAGVVLRTPSYLPTGFALRVIEVGGKDRKRVTQRYANGLTVVSLISSPQMPFGKKVLEQLGSTGSGFINGPRGQRAYIWRDAQTATNFAVLSNLPDDQIKRIADSVH